MKKLLIPMITAVIAIGASAFTTKKTVGYFYEYTSSSTAIGDIQNENNYVRSSASCPTGSDVCGVLLPTNRATGQHPVTSEFDAEKAALWQSQDDGAPANGNIQMKN